MDENGRIASWDAYCNSTSLSCQVVLKDPADKEVRDKLEALLYQMRKNPADGVECVYNKEEVEKEQHLPEILRCAGRNGRDKLWSCLHRGSFSEAG